MYLYLLHHLSIFLWEGMLVTWNVVKNALRARGDTIFHLFGLRFYSHSVGNYKLTYELQFICDSKVNAGGASMVIGGRPQNSEHCALPKHVSSWGRTRWWCSASCFSSYTTNRFPFCGLVSAMSLAFWKMISLFKKSLQVLKCCLVFLSARSYHVPYGGNTCIR